MPATPTQQKPLTRELKRCKGCGETKAVQDFTRCDKNRDGYWGKCKTCCAAMSAEWRRANPEKVAAGNKRHMERHPDKARARSVVTSAVERGTLMKPDRCEGCGELFAAPELHAHHRDYSKPLEVEWLCVGCHTHHHRETADA